METKSYYLFTTNWPDLYALNNETIIPVTTQLQNTHFLFVAFASSISVSILCLYPKTQFIYDLQFKQVQHLPLQAGTQIHKLSLLP
ncbi:hypothetical protein SLEP1_g54303 [Rubroshorea leprosula]|uniref:Uncharacterized protein n=1 Tax=Rubroshorea leprosula TaxID=152421 RepID=A0AAV5MEX5_9ROSI|nr:hypothetical protein SLEP1_g54303 [Rubroshorea leprosula]